MRQSSYHYQIIAKYVSMMKEMVANGLRAQQLAAQANQQSQQVSNNFYYFSI